MITLAIDTSTARGSVALLAYGDLAFEEHFSADRTHTAKLFTALRTARSRARHLDRIAVGLGPGSYAGVRIAIAAAFGLQLALGCELFGLPSFAALEHGWKRSLVIGDARRGMFYCTAVEDGICIDGPMLVEEMDLRERIDGLGWPVFATERIETFPTAQIALPSAAILARLAAQPLSVVQRGDLEPIYLREPHITQPKVRPEPVAMIIE
jgi:tRNA threonylcarbamoyl adenosine modification protein YeaZ